MGGSIDPERALAAAMSLGTSEAFQKKPFQDLGQDRPVGGASASPIRFIPGGGATLAGLADEGKLGGPPPLTEEEKAQQRRAAQQTVDNETAARNAAQQDLAARTETPQEAVDARRRAIAASQTLGGGKRRASQTLTTPGMTLSGSYP